MKTLSVAVALVLCASSASAQKGFHNQHPMRPPHGTTADPQHRTNMPPHRQALEQRFRQRSEQVVREKLGLSDEQVTRLRTVNSNIGAQRNTLVEQERAVRSSLRDEMARGGAADQSKVAQLMAQAHDLQSKRFALQQVEQQQLSGFLTPVQVAQYVGFQAQIRQHIREMQRDQNDDQPVPNP